MKPFREVTDDIVVEDAPFGKFSVKVRTIERERHGIFFAKVKEVDVWRRVDKWGRLAYPWWECAVFDTKGEADLFAAWVLRRIVDGKLQ